MQFQRISSAEMLVVGPVEAVREATWYALWNAGVILPLIDTEKNLVSGTTGDGILTAARVGTAHFDVRPEGILVSFESKPVLGGTIEFGAGQRKAQNMANVLERILVGGFTPLPEEVTPAELAVAPIAAPTGEATRNRQPVTIRPRYGAVLAPRRGIIIFCYGILSLLFCQILAPVPFVYGISTLKDYRRQGDPGDKGLVIAGMVVAALVTLGFILFLIAVVGTK